MKFEVDEVVYKLFQSLCSRYQGNLKTSIRASNFIFDSVQMMYYKCHNVNFRRRGSYINSPNWTRKDKSSNKPEKLQR